MIMKFLLWLVLVAAINSNPREIIRRRHSSSNHNGTKKEKILKALSRLMSEEKAKISRNEQNEFEEDFSEGHRGASESERQILGSPSFNPLEKCETTGFETRTREECKEVSEIECKPIMVKKVRTEIVEKCETLLDRNTCNVTYTGVPKQQCVPRTSKR